MVEADIHKADVSLVGVVWCGVVWWDSPLGGWDLYI